MQNLFIGKGNLASSPELKILNGRNGEFQVATMRVMFARYSRNKETNEVEQTGGFWREVEIYGYKAADVAKHLRKGSRVLVIGEEHDYTGTDDAGNEVQVIKIVAEDVALQLTRIEKITFAAPAARHSQQEPDYSEAL